MRDAWFVRQIEGLGPLSSGWDRATVLALSGQLLRVMEKSSGPVLERLFTALLSDESVGDPLQSMIVGFMETSIESIMDQLMALPGGFDDPSASPLLTAVAAFSQANRRLLEPHLRVIQHYLASKLPATVEAAVTLLSVSFPKVSSLAIESLDTVVEALTKTVLTGTEQAVKAAIDCLYVHCERCKGDFALILRLWEKFSKYLKSQSEASAASSARALFALGCLCRHSVSDQHAGSSDIPQHVRSATTLFIKWHRHGQEQIVRAHALQALSMALAALPALSTDSNVCNLFISILHSNDSVSQQIILSCLLRLLDTETCADRDAGKADSKGFDPTAANRSSVAASVAIVVSKYAGHLIKRAVYLEDARNQALCLRSFERLLLLAATNPFDIVPVVMAMSSSRDLGLRLEALRLMDIAFDRYSSMASGQVSKVLSLSYAVCNGPLSLYYEKLSERKTRGRLDFTTAVQRALVDETSDEGFVAWLCQAVSLLHFRTADEVQDMLKGINGASALTADAIFSAQSVDLAPDRPALLRFILLSHFSSHLSANYASLLAPSTKARKQHHFRIRPNLFTVPHQWPTATKEEAYSEAVRIIEEDVIRVGMNELSAHSDDKVSEQSMKSPTLVQPSVKAPKSKSLSRRKRLEKEMPYSRPPSEGCSSQGLVRRSCRSSAKISYIESSDSD